jgi:hypothetical protein
MAWIKTLVKFPEKCPSTMAARGRSTERVKLQNKPLGYCVNFG